LISVNSQPVEATYRKRIRKAKLRNHLNQIERLASDRRNQNRNILKNLINQMLSNIRSAIQIDRIRATPKLDKTSKASMTSLLK
jgi:hypothetical protein